MSMFRELRVDGTESLVSGWYWLSDGTTHRPRYVRRVEPLRPGERASYRVEHESGQHSPAEQWLVGPRIELAAAVLGECL